MGIIIISEAMASIKSSALFLSASLMIVAGSCPEQFVQYGHTCYYHSQDNGNQPLAWEDARTFCQQLSSNVQMTVDLASLDDNCEDDKALMKSLILKSQDVWLGAFIHPLEIQWLWVDDRCVDIFSNFWYPGYPSTSLSQDCMVTYKSSSSNSVHRAYVQEQTCTHSEHFVCQI